MIVLWGIPTKHDLIFLWLGVGMAAFSLEASRVVRDWLPLVGIMFAYDVLRGAADGLAFPVRETPQIRVETSLFGKPAPTVWLQEHFWHGPHHLALWDYAAWFLHLTHFFATFIAAAAIWVVARDQFARYSAMICTLALTGFATYVLYPAAPPWMAAQQGNLGESNRIIPIAWKHIPVAHFNSLFEHGVRYANNVAAIPSLHAAYALLFSVYLWRVLPRWTRPVLAVYPLAMSWALVYTGEHYLVDCVLGWIYAAAVVVAVDRIFDRRAEHVRRTTPALAD